MLEYWVNRKKVECRAIFNEGKVGQLVILDHINFGETPNLADYPLAAYLQPSIFTITEKVEGKEGYYELLDIAGNCVKVRDELYGASCSYLYDAQAWILFRKEQMREKFSRKDGRIRHLEGNVDLLKDILVRQGFRVITEQQARELGIKE